MSLISCDTYDDGIIRSAVSRVGRVVGTRKKLVLDLDKGARLYRSILFLGIISCWKNNKQSTADVIIPSEKSFSSRGRFARSSVSLLYHYVGNTCACWFFTRTNSSCANKHARQTPANGRRDKNKYHYGRPSLCRCRFHESKHSRGKTKRINNKILLYYFLRPIMFSIVFSRQAFTRKPTAERVRRTTFVLKTSWRISVTKKRVKKSGWSSTNTRRADKTRWQRVDVLQVFFFDFFFFLTFDRRINEYNIYLTVARIR